MHGEANSSRHSLPRTPSACKISSAQSKIGGRGLQDITTDNKYPLTATPSPPVSPPPLLLLTAVTFAAAADRRRESGWRPLRQPAAAAAVAASRCSGRRSCSAQAASQAAGGMQRFAAGAGIPACMQAAAGGGCSSGSGPLLQPQLERLHAGGQSCGLRPAAVCSMQACIHTSSGRCSDCRSGSAPAPARRWVRRPAACSGL